MSTTLEDAAELRGVLAGDDELRHFTDPAEAAANRPCVLLGPPATDYVNRVRTWSVRCLADDLAGGLTTWEQLQDLEARVVALLPVEASRTESFRLSEDLPAVPCHVLTVRTST